MSGVPAAGGTGVSEGLNAQQLEWGLPAAEACVSAVPVTGESGVRGYSLGKDASVWLLVSITQG